jgi:hypothetical protein
MMEVLNSSEPSVLTRATRRNIPGDAIFQTRRNWIIAPSVLALELDGTDWSASHTKSGSITPCIERWVGPVTGIDAIEKKKMWSLPNIKLWSIAHKAQSLVNIHTELHLHSRNRNDWPLVYNLTTISHDTSDVLSAGCNISFVINF